jgi:Sec-independent protein translocase protein TatA
VEWRRASPGDDRPAELDLDPRQVGEERIQDVLSSVGAMLVSDRKQASEVDDAEDHQQRQEHEEDEDADLDTGALDTISISTSPCTKLLANLVECAEGSQGPCFARGAGLEGATTMRPCR